MLLISKGYDWFSNPYQKNRFITHFRVSRNHKKSHNTIQYHYNEKLWNVNGVLAATMRRCVFYLPIRSILVIYSFIICAWTVWVSCYITISFHQLWLLLQYSLIHNISLFIYFSEDWMWCVVMQIDLGYKSIRINIF